MAIILDPEGLEIAALTEMVPAFAGRHVLEVGCGDGRLTRGYARHAASVVAIDPDESAIATLQANPPSGKVDIRAIGFEQLLAPDRGFDIIVLSWSL